MPRRIPVLDAVDAVLVRELQRDGRATFQALADRVGLSRTAVRARVQSLLETGVVRVVGIVHSRVVGTGAIGHVSVAVDGAARVVAQAIAKRSAVRFAAVIAGRFALIAEVRARDDDTLAAEMDEIRRIPGVRAAEVFRSVVVVRDAFSVVRVEGGARGGVVEAPEAIRAVGGGPLRESRHHLDIVKESHAAELPGPSPAWPSAVITRSTQSIA